MIEAGQPFPEGIVLPDDEGRDIDLDDVLRQGPLVLFFYPADGTPGCTREVCSFRDVHAEFAAAGATVYGVSRDSPRSHRRFRARHDLPYGLLADPQGMLHERLGIPRLLGISARVTVVVAPDRQVLHVFRSQIQATRHAKEALEAVAATGPRVK